MQVDLAKTTKAMMDKLAQSGFGLDDVKKLQFKAYSTEQSKELGLSLTAAGFEIPYFLPNGKKNCFSRFRLLEAPVVTGFASAAAKPPKYLQQAGTDPEIYLPPYVDWVEIQKTAEVPLIITEGELKAGCATKRTFPTIGLGGVWSFRIKKKNITFLPSLDAFIYKKRKVFIIFDSDALLNPQVLMAENHLARELLKRGAKVFIVRLPHGADGQKIGLDDYLEAHTDAEFKELMGGGSEWGPTRELHELNEEVLYIRDPGLVMRLKTLQRMSPDAFVGHQYANRTFMREVQGPKGPRREEVSTAREWIRWPARAEVEKAVYEPGQDRFTDGCLNVWPGWGCDAVKGDIGPWKKLLSHLFAGFPIERRYFEQWLACPLQHPGLKMYVAAVVWGKAQGTGKSLIGNTMGRIYGKNFYELDKATLQDQNQTFWAENRQFILGDEVSADDKRGGSTYLLNLITREIATIKIKYVPIFSIRDCINWYLTSNKPDSFFMQDKDRRMFIHEVVGDPLDRSFYLDFLDWRDKRGGASALFYHLLNISLEGFDPHAPAMNTAAKREMQRLAKSGLGAWIADLKEYPDNVLRLDDMVLEWTLATTRDLLNLYDPNQRTGTTLNAFARELTSSGFKRFNQILLSNRQRVELWVVRHKLSVKNPAPRWLASQYEKEHNIGKRY